MKKNKTDVQLLSSPDKCSSETDDDDDDDNKVVESPAGPSKIDRQSLKRVSNLSTATSTPSLARTWTCFNCGFRTKNSVTWHCINCGRVSYLAPVYKETLPFKGRRRLRERAAKLRAKRSLSMDAVVAATERHHPLVKCGQCAREEPASRAGQLNQFPWQPLGSKCTNKVSCVHNEEDFFGSPIRHGEVGGGGVKCDVCGVCQWKDKRKTNESRFTITTLARRRVSSDDDGGGGDDADNDDTVKNPGGMMLGKKDSGAGFLIAVKDWLMPATGRKERPPPRRLESGGGYEVIRKNLLNPRAQPVYNNEFHLTPRVAENELKEDEEAAAKLMVVGAVEGKVVVAAATRNGVVKLAEEERVASSGEPVYAIVNKAAKASNKQPRTAEGNTTKYSFLTDTLSRKGRKDVVVEVNKQQGEGRERILNLSEL